MTSWTAARQPSLFFTILQSLLKLITIESVMWSNHFILYYPLLLLPSILAQHQGLFQWVSSSHQVANTLFGTCLLKQTRYSGLISFRIDWVWSPSFPRDSQESSPAPQFEIISSLKLSLLYGPTLTSVHYYWKNHSFDYMDLFLAKWFLSFLKHGLHFS